MSDKNKNNIPQEAANNSHDSEEQDLTMHINHSSWIRMC